MMDKSAHQYETTFIINASLDDAQTDAIISRIQEVIAKNAGSVSAVEKWGRKRLAYPIQKKNNGYYVVILFSAGGDTVAKVERQYQLDENILRYLTVQLDSKALQSRRSVGRPEEEAAPAEATPAEPAGAAVQAETKKEPEAVA